MQSVRDRAANVANQDAIAKIAVEQLTSIPRCEQQNVANQAVMDRRVDTVVEYLLWKERVANQDGIEILLPGLP
jgi:hypothetical protein